MHFFQIAPFQSPKSLDKVKMVETSTVQYIQKAKQKGVQYKHKLKCGNSGAEGN